MSTWFKLQHSILADPKLVGASDAAFRTWVNGFAYSGMHLTNGIVDRDGYALMRGSEADELVARGLWMIHEDGWEIVNYLRYQQSREQVERTRARDAKRKRKARRDQPKPSATESVGSPSGVRAADRSDQIDRSDDVLVGLRAESRPDASVAPHIPGTGPIPGFKGTGGLTHDPETVDLGLASISDIRAARAAIPEEAS